MLLPTTVTLEQKENILSTDFDSPHGWSYFVVLFQETIHLSISCAQLTAYLFVYHKANYCYSWVYMLWLPVLYTESTHEKRYSDGVTFFFRR